MTAVFCAAAVLCGCAGRTSEPVLESWSDDGVVSEGNALSDAEASPGKGESSGTESGAAGGAALSDAGVSSGKRESSGTESGAAGGAALSDAGASSGKGESSGTESGAAGERANSDAATSPLGGGAAISEEISSLIKVHVCGAVRREGVYSLPEGSRVADAIEAAGGFSGEASTDYLNLAAVLGDAWQIRVPTRDEAAALRTSGQAPFPDGISVSGCESVDPGGGVSRADSDESSRGREKVNINTADSAELKKIPGVGEVRARQILEFREANGRFESIEDLMKISGIKEASFLKMRDYVTVE